MKNIIWRHNFLCFVGNIQLLFYRSPGGRRGRIKVPTYKPPVPLEDVFSQVEAEFETSYLEVSDYIELWNKGSLVH
jgi:hypothetical protein